MDHFREIKNRLTWHNEGKFEAELINNVITKVNFCEPGKGLQDTGKVLTSTNYKYLEAVYNCLGELFAFIRDENKRLGYHFSNEDSLQFQGGGDIMESEYSTIAAETNVRPLINYSHKQELIMSAAKNDDEPMRDIG